MTADAQDREEDGMDERRCEHIAWRYRQGNGPWNYTEDRDAIQADLADEVEKVYADPTPDAPDAPERLRGADREGQDE